MTQLKLVHSAETLPPVRDPVMLPPAEVEQPYVADWMVAEGMASFRARKSVRRRRQLLLAAALALAASAAWALFRP